MILRKAIGVLLITSSFAGISAIPAEAENVIHITTASELAAISNDTNGSYVLDNDIHLSGTWTPINEFYGSFDGAGHKITGLRINSTGSMLGLFKSIGLKGEVKNIDVYGSINGASLIGAIAGQSHGSISDCNSYVTITATGQYTGGIVGMTEGYGITRCTNHGNVTGNTCTGGIAGYVGDTVLNCINLGTITGNDDNTGGIVGVNRGIISACYNTGAVNGDYYVGGIVGYNRYSVKNSYNTATVTSTALYSGGIAGTSEEAAGSGFKPTILYCYNIGGIVGDPNYRGGIVGDKDNITVVTKCVYLSGIRGISSGSTYKDTITELSINQFKIENYFSGWDLDSVWAMSAERPVLQAIPELEILREPATASAVKLDEFTTNTDTGKKASAWKVTVTPGTDVITNLNVKINNTPANETEGISIPKVSGGAIVFGIVVNILGSNDVTSVTAVVNGEDIAASIE